MQQLRLAQARMTTYLLPARSCGLTHVFHSHRCLSSVASRPAKGGTVSLPIPPELAGSATAVQCEVSLILSALNTSVKRLSYAIKRSDVASTVSKDCSDAMKDTDRCCIGCTSPSHCTSACHALAQRQQHHMPVASLSPLASACASSVPPPSPSRSSIVPLHRPAPPPPLPTTALSSLNCTACTWPAMPAAELLSLAAPFHTAAQFRTQRTRHGPTSCPAACCSGELRLS